MELTSLYYFKVAAEQENITRAAEQLYISQPALSKAIAKLEASLSVTLFERRKGRVRLSSMGRVYYEYVKSAFAALEQGERRLEELKKTSNDKVAVASPVAELLRALIFDFVSSSDCSNIQIDQFLYEQALLESKLLEGELDFAVTPITIENSEIEQTKLAEEEIFAVVSSGHPLAGQKYVRLEQLRDERFLINEASFDEKIVRVHCGMVGFEPRVLLRSNESELIRQGVEDGLGVSLVPANVVARQSWERAAPLRVTDVELVRLISIAKRRDQILSPNARRLYRYAVNYFRDLGGVLRTRFDAEFPLHDFPGRRRLGINNLKSGGAITPGNGS